MHENIRHDEGKVFQILMLILFGNETVGSICDIYMGGGVISGVLYSLNMAGLSRNGGSHCASIVHSHVTNGL